MSEVPDLPGDNHVHTEWSWDAVEGAMDATCARAEQLRLPSVAFTEHADLTPWVVRPGDAMPDVLARWLRPDGRVAPRPLDVEGYLACLQRCRERYPELRILSGVELSEPHWHPEQTAALLAGGRFHRVLGSVHSVGGRAEPRLVDHAMGDTAAADVVRSYLAEAAVMAASDAPFSVLAHIDYPVRHWPVDAGPFRPADFEEEFRAVLTVLAASGRALEINTRVPLAPELVAWWADAGGDAVSFGSDAHRPADLANGFAAAADVALGCGFRPGTDAAGLWSRRA
ncbi:PHP domain-containing protein [Pseudonocardia kunmingensis]|uniref:PHP domain-containing protein n=1 Tax=Pseudonocardia kunmingensis TaxID=630975 RepID=UPI0024827A57|nr:PHP domain-containing protein [Pseudonocardia kunmingensis]